MTDWTVAEFWTKIRGAEGEAMRVQFQKGLDNFYFSIEPSGHGDHVSVERYQPSAQDIEQEQVLHRYAFQTHYNMWLAKMHRQGYLLKWLDSF